MKYLLVLLGTMALMATASAQQSTGAVLHKDRLELLKAVKKDVMIRAALMEARAQGERCVLQIVEAKNSGPAGINFKAQINCSVEPTAELGGGIVRMIRITATAFGDLLDHVTITVDRAG